MNYIHLAMNFARACYYAWRNRNHPVLRVRSPRERVVVFAAPPGARHIVGAYGSTFTFQTDESWARARIAVYEEQQKERWWLENRPEAN